MATIQARNVETSFSALTTTAVTCVAFLVLGFGGEEILKRLTRSGFKTVAEGGGGGEGNKEGDVRDRGVEDWAMGYLYRARTYIPYAPTLDYSTRPFVWIYRSAWELDQDWFDQHVGGDASGYVRFLRGCFYWILLQLLTVFPTLLSINFIYADSSIATTSIDRASLTSLTASANGKRLLPIHVVCIWFISLTWFITLFWVGYGIVRTRRNGLRKLLRDSANSFEDSEQLVDEDRATSVSGGRKSDEEKGNSLEFREDGSRTGSKEDTLKGRELEELERHYSNGRLPGALRDLLTVPIHPASDSNSTSYSYSGRGWRYRTVLMRNIPEAMRSRKAIREYFERGLRVDSEDLFVGEDRVERRSEEKKEDVRDIFSEERHAARIKKEKTGKNVQLDNRDTDFSGSTLRKPSSAPPSPNVDNSKLLPLLLEIIPIQREQRELNELYVKYVDTQGKLESLHVLLIRNCMEWIGKEKLRREGGEEKVEKKGWWDLRGKKANLGAGDIEKRAFRPTLSADFSEPSNPSEDLLYTTLLPYLSPHETPNLPSIYITVSTLPRHLLDPFQPIIKLRHLFKNQRVPGIDYYSGRLGLLGSLMSVEREKFTGRCGQGDGKDGEGEEDLKGMTSAFVTFRSAKEARRARMEMKTNDWETSRTSSSVLNASISSSDDTAPSSPTLMKSPASTAFLPSPITTEHKKLKSRRTKKTLHLGSNLRMECKLDMAPEVRDLDWNRLVYVTLSGDIVRGLILQIIMWAATIFWVIPLTFLVGLLSITEKTSPSIGRYIPSLAAYLANNKISQSLFTSLIPTTIVALLGMLVPTLIGMLTRNGQTFITVSKVHAEVQARYYKWLLFNIVIVFCVGLAAFNAFLTAFRQPTSILPVIADAFPKGATFFVSWTLLVVGIHHGVETSLFGIPFINHGSIRKLRAPRQREEEAQPRSFSYFYWIPNHLLVLAVTAIFAILNPLVIAFNFAYFSFALVVFKNQFAHVYWRRWYENNGRLVYRRCFRYSLDVFIIGQVVALALFEVLKLFKLGGAVIPLIPLTAFIKLVGTRWFDKLMEEIDEAEIDLVCGEGDEYPDLSVPLLEEDLDLRHLPLSEALETISTFAQVTLPSLTFRPKMRLPNVPSPSNVGGGHPRARSEVHSPHFAGPTAPRPISQSLNGTPSAGASPRMLQGGGENSLSGAEPKEFSTFFVVDRRRSSPSDQPILHDDAKQSPPLQLVTHHPHVVRDDRPLSNIRYSNPALIFPFATSLWLPRDPLQPLDLGDTIDWAGTAFVSSEGGKGIIGSWDEFLAEAEEEEGSMDHTGSDTQNLITSTAERRMTTSSNKTMDDIIQQRLRSESNTSGSRYSKRPDGTERIRVADEVAARVEQETRLSPAVGTPPLMRRRNTGASIESASRAEGSFFPQMKRRGTGTSALSRESGVTVISPPQESPEIVEAGLLPPESPIAVVRHPFASKPSSPAIPSFDPQLITTPPSSTQDTFPPSAYLTPTPLARKHSNSSPSPVQVTPNSLHPPRASSAASGSIVSNLTSHSPTSLRPPRVIRTRQIRSDSHVRSIREEDEPLEGSAVVSISQGSALREELYEEARVASRLRQEEREKREGREKEDRKGGWFTQLMLHRAGEPDTE